MGPRDVAKMVRKIIDPWVRSLQLSIGRCVLNFVSDSTGIQTIQASVLANEIKEMERFQNYGFTSVPKASAEGVCVFVGGNRENGICIALDDRVFRLKNLTPGQVALYDSFGSKIVMQDNGNISVECQGDVTVDCDDATITAATEAKISAPTATIEADNAIIDGTNIELEAGATEAAIKGTAFQTWVNTHTHVSSAPGSPTSPPAVASDPSHLSTIVKVGG